MKFNDLMKRVAILEEDTELVDTLYFEALNRLDEIRNDVTRLDDIKHLRRVIKPFLVSWGMSARVVNREDSDWIRLGTTLRSLEPQFRELRNERFYTIQFTDIKIDEAISEIYRRMRSIPYLGGATTISKISHLINPEIFVMWDRDIRQKYGQSNCRIRDTPSGYIEFLKEMQKDLKEAILGHQAEHGKSIGTSEKEIRLRFKNKTLARLLDEYNLTLVREEYKNIDEKEVSKGNIWSLSS